MSDQSYRIGTKSERLADGICHALGIGLSLVGSVILILWAFAHLGAGSALSLTIYGVALVGCFTASAFYHLTPWEERRALFRRIDHALIYVKIAGTYTPLVVLIGTGYAYGVLGLVWALAALGVLVKLFVWGASSNINHVLYLGLGWLSLLLIGGLAQVIPSGALALIVAGGVIYSVGALLYMKDHMPFQNAIWHSHVLVASACMFTAIAIGMTQLPAA